jgi:hypothetical protein
MLLVNGQPAPLDERALRQHRPATIAIHQPRFTRSARSRLRIRVPLEGRPAGMLKRAP